MKILALGPNSTKSCTHNLWVTRRLEMQKLGAGWGEVLGVESGDVGVQGPEVCV